MSVSELLSCIQDDALRSQVNLWLQLDRNPDSQKETATLILGSEQDVIKDHFGCRLAFGTAGLRAIMAPGFNRINDVTIQQTTQGLCAFLLESFGAQACKERGVVIGRDGRHHSKRFAQLTAAVFLSRGFRVILFDEVVATPLVPFTVLSRKALAGIVVTASHNPKQYNGYKVYGENGIQITSPTDDRISDAILKNQMFWPEVEAFFDREKGTCLPAPGGALLGDLRNEIWKEYTTQVSKALCARYSETSASPLRVVYTAMHGVGAPFARTMLESFGFSEGIIDVKEQCFPDPDFPTVSFPNPEEKGALDLAMRTADANGSSVIVANDPDADRLACAEKYKGMWRQFTGDELGILLASYAFEVQKSRGVEPSKMVFGCSLVSSRMLKSFAEAEGCVFMETLTGFKWISRKAAELEAASGLIPVLLYEEALGYALCSFVRDKDGISACAVLVELATKLYSEGSNLHERLEQLRDKYGSFQTNNGYFTCDPEIQKKFFDSIRNGGNYVNELAGIKVTSVRDIAKGVDTGHPSGQCELPTSGGNVITLRLENGAVCTLRSSGTEPKLKYYMEIRDDSREGKHRELLDIVSAIASVLPGK